MGDIDKTKIFTAVGQALTRWENLEGSLAALFGELVAPDYGANSLAARRAYSAVRTFEARIVMLLVAAEAHFSIFQEPQLAKFTRNFLKDAQQFGARRNDIAHWQVGQHHPDQDRNFSLEPIPPLGWSLKPPFANEKHTYLDNMARYAMASPEIDYFAGEFTKLFSRCVHLQVEFQQKKGRRYLARYPELLAELKALRPHRTR